MWKIHITNRTLYFAVFLSGQWGLRVGCYFNDILSELRGTDAFLIHVAMQTSNIFIFFFSLKSNEGFLNEGNVFTHTRAVCILLQIFDQPTPKLYRVIIFQYRHYSAGNAHRSL